MYPYFSYCCFAYCLLFLLHLFPYLSSVSAIFTVWHHFYIRPCISLTLTFFHSLFMSLLLVSYWFLIGFLSVLVPAEFQNPSLHLPHIALPPLSRYWQINHGLFVTLLTNIWVGFCHVSGKHGLPTDPPLYIVTLLTKIHSPNCHVTDNQLLSRYWQVQG